MSADLIEELRDGLEGVTPGPWRMSIPDLGYCSNYLLTDAPDFAPTESQRWKHLIADFDDCAHGEVNAAHIARCSPENIRALLDALAAKDAALSEMAKERDEARASWKQAIDLYEMEVARVDPALAALSEMRAELEQVKDYHRNCSDEAQRLLSEKHDLLAELALVRKDIPPEAVKALEWQDFKLGEALSESRAYDGFGQNYVVFKRGPEILVDLPDGSVSTHTSFDAGRAAAQADYEARIMSALIPAKPAMEVVEAHTVAWLIERKFVGDHTQWYAENEDDGWHWWTETAHEAKRFALKAEAEAFPAYQMIARDPAISITEHVFLAALQAPATPDAQTEVEK